MPTTDNLVFEATTRLIIGAFYDVYNDLGYGFLESVYQHAMYVALRKRALRSQREVRLPVSYDVVNVGDYRADLIVEKKIIVSVSSFLVPYCELSYPFDPFGSSVSSAFRCSRRTHTAYDLQITHHRP